MKIAAFAYYKDYALNQVVVPEDTTSIGNNSFMDCINLKEIFLPTTLEIIETNAFMDCERLENIVFPRKMQKIKPEAFIRCNSIKNLILPEQMDEIEKYAFSMCYNIEYIKMPSIIRRISPLAFFGCSPKKIEYRGKIFDNLDEFLSYHGAQSIYDDYTLPEYEKVVSPVIIKKTNVPEKQVETEIEL